jgi:hypothetical protein
MRRQTCSRAGRSSARPRMPRNYSRCSLETGAPGSSRLNNAGASATRSMMHLPAHLDAGCREHGLVLIVTLRDVKHRFIPCDPNHRVTITRLIVFSLCLADEKVAAQGVEGNGQGLPLLVDKIIGTVAAVLDLKHLLSPIGIVRAAFVDHVAPALLERRSRARERKLRLLGLKAAREEETGRCEQQQRTKPCATLCHGEKRVLSDVA